MMNLGTARRLSAGEKASWAAVRELCCRTGNNGDPIAPERWELFARIWIEPYEKILPHWTYIAESGEAVVGYLTGCPDTRVFHRARFWLTQLARLSPRDANVTTLLGNVRGRLVQQHYNQGVRLYREEKLPAAIHEWRTVLQYDPNHEGAKKNIESAERLLKGLQERQQKQSR